MYRSSHNRAGTEGGNIKQSGVRRLGREIYRVSKQWKCNSQGWMGKSGVRGTRGQTMERVSVQFVLCCLHYEYGYFHCLLILSSQIISTQVVTLTVHSQSQYSLPHGNLLHEIWVTQHKFRPLNNMWERAQSTTPSHTRHIQAAYLCWRNRPTPWSPLFNI